MAALELGHVGNMIFQNTIHKHDFHVRSYLKERKVEEMLPWYKDFKGIIEKYKDYGSKVYGIKLMTTL
jgi:hypothetical protein